MKLVEDEITLVWLGGSMVLGTGGREVVNISDIYINRPKQVPKLKRSKKMKFEQTKEMIGKSCAYPTRVERLLNWLFDDNNDGEIGDERGEINPFYPIYSQDLTTISSQKKMNKKDDLSLKVSSINLARGATNSISILPSIHLMIQSLSLLIESMCLKVCSLIWFWLII